MVSCLLSMEEMFRIKARVCILWCSNKLATHLMYSSFVRGGRRCSTFKTFVWWPSKQADLGVSKNLSLSCPSLWPSPKISTLRHPKCSTSVVLSNAINACSRNRKRSKSCSNWQQRTNSIWEGCVTCAQKPRQWLLTASRCHFKPSSPHK